MVRLTLLERIAFPSSRTADVVFTGQVILYTDGVATEEHFLEFRAWTQVWDIVELKEARELRGEPFGLLLFELSDRSSLRCSNFVLTELE